MPRPLIAVAAIAVCAILFPAAQGRAEQMRAALIVGNATYTDLPGITACARSANLVSAALRTIGFQVTERQDASTGAIDAGIGEFSQHLAEGKGPGFVYVCGYGTDFNDRTFLLPTTAKIARPSDVMTQGVLAKAMLATVTHDPAAVAVVVFDLVAKPDGPKLGLDALIGLPVPEGVGVIAATETPPAEGPTPLAVALASGLAGPQVSTEGLLSGVQAKLASSQTTVAVIHTPVHPGFLAGAPAIVAPPVVAPPVVTPLPPPTPVASIPAERLPDEALMTETDRRKVQTALIRLGYYNNPIDAVFGPETRAAIRRYQHEIGSETTGRLTGDQASRLVSTR